MLSPEWRCLSDGNDIRIYVIRINPWLWFVIQTTRTRTRTRTTTRTRTWHYSEEVATEATKRVECTHMFLCPPFIIKSKVEILISWSCIILCQFHLRGTSPRSGLLLSAKTNFRVFSLAGVTKKSIECFQRSHTPGCKQGLLWKRDLGCATSSPAEQATSRMWVHSFLNQDHISVNTSLSKLSKYYTICPSLLPIFLSPPFVTRGSFLFFPPTYLWRLQW